VFKNMIIVVATGVLKWGLECPLIEISKNITRFVTPVLSLHQ
jgi:hypothetical protein